MKLTRRDLSLILPALAVRASAQQNARQLLPARVYDSTKIPYVPEAATANKKGRQFFRGNTHGGFNLEMHETILGPGTRTHEPHKHEHEEIVIVVEGTIEALIDGKTELAPPGSVIYFGSNQPHSARNAGQTPSRYYVVELRGTEA